ncbi:DUF6493 family protein [Streptomyces sp. M10(2022)]
MPAHGDLVRLPQPGGRDRGAAGTRGPLPFLLATPTWTTGTIDPSELAARLAAYEDSGTEPGPADLDQALLRLDREVPLEARAAADRLTSPAGGGWPPGSPRAACPIPPSPGKPSG